MAIADDRHRYTKSSRPHGPASPMGTLRAKRTARCQGALLSPSPPGQRTPPHRAERYDENKLSIAGVFDGTVAERYTPSANNASITNQPPAFVRDGDDYSTYIDNASGVFPYGAFFRSRPELRLVATIRYRTRSSSIVRRTKGPVGSRRASGSGSIWTMASCPAVSSDTNTRPINWPTAPR